MVGFHKEMGQWYCEIPVDKYTFISLFKWGLSWIGAHCVSTVLLIFSVTLMCKQAHMVILSFYN